MDHLALEGYQPITALDLARKRSNGDLLARHAVLTFDDAFTDFETVVMRSFRDTGSRPLCMSQPRTREVLLPGFVPATRTGDLSFRGVRFARLSRQESRWLRIVTLIRSLIACRFH